MRAKELEMEVASKALAGSNPNEPIVTMLTLGLRTLREVRADLKGDMQHAVDSGACSTRGYCLTRLPYGAKLAVCYMQEARPFGLSKLPGTNDYPVTIVRLRTGTLYPGYDPADAARQLAQRIKGSVTVSVKIAHAIERARRSCYALAEEGTRWLL